MVLCHILKTMLVMCIDLRGKQNHHFKDWLYLCISIHMQCIIYFLQAAVLGMMYITGMSYGLIYIGIAFNQSYSLEVFDKEPKLMFSGGLISCTFWVCHECLLDIIDLFRVNFVG